MKKPLKATPYPKRRKPLHPISIPTSTNNLAIPSPNAAVTAKKPAKIGGEICARKTADDPQILSPLQRLHVAHRNLTNLIQKIDGLVVGAHKLKLAGKLSPHEIDSFTNAITHIENSMQEWSNLFSSAANRASESFPNKENEHSITHQELHELSLKQNDQCLISNSPLLPSLGDNLTKTRTTFLFLTPDQAPPSSSRKRVTFARHNLTKSFSAPSSPTSIHANVVDPNFTPLLTLIESTLRSCSLSDLPPTPAMPSPPRSVVVRRPSLSSSSSCPSTPSFALCKTDRSDDLETPRPSGDILAKYPRWFAHFHNSGGRSSSESSRIPSISPPKTCALIRPSPSSFGSSPRHLHLAFKSPVLALTSPFRTPGLALRLPEFQDNLKSDALCDDQILEKWG